MLKVGDSVQVWADGPHDDNKRNPERTVWVGTVVQVGAKRIGVLYQGLYRRDFNAATGRAVSEYSAEFLKHGGPMSLKLEPHEVEAWDRFMAAAMGVLYRGDRDAGPYPRLTADCAHDADDAILARRSRLPAPEAVAPAYTWRLLEPTEIIAGGDEFWSLSRQGWHSAALDVGAEVGSAYPIRRRVKP